jgi:hypothetical protein
MVCVEQKDDNLKNTDKIQMSKLLKYAYTIIIFYTTISFVSIFVLEKIYFANILRLSLKRQ